MSGQVVATAHYVTEMHRRGVSVPVSARACGLTSAHILSHYLVVQDEEVEAAMQDD